METVFLVEDEPAILNLPSEMTTVDISRDEEGYVQYRADYSFNTGETAEENKSEDRTPASMIVYQTPYVTETIGLRAECIFLSYPDDSGYQDPLSDGEVRAAARKWADRTLKIPAEDILEDWTLNPDSSAAGTVTYLLKTVSWTVFLQMNNNGECCWCGLYPSGTVQTP